MKRLMREQGLDCVSRAQARSASCPNSQQPRDRIARDDRQRGRRVFEAAAVWDKPRSKAAQLLSRTVAGGCVSVPAVRQIEFCVLGRTI
jgi:hypothetical protein